MARGLTISHGDSIAGDPGLIPGQEHIFSKKEYLFLSRGLTISHGINIAGDPGLIPGQEHIFSNKEYLFLAPGLTTDTCSSPRMTAEFSGYLEVAHGTVRRQKTVCYVTSRKPHL